MMTIIGMPAVPKRQAEYSVGAVTFTAGHHFALGGEASVDELVDSAEAPLSVILQVTKRCNFDCSFCSETLQLPDPTLDQLDTIRRNLAGVQRVFLSGGEPLLRRDFGDIVDMYTSGFILGIPTNATRGLQHAASMVGKVAFVNVGLEGPRSTTNRVRGDYDAVMAGVRAFLDHGLPLSLSAVVYRSTLHALPFTYQIADVVGAGKLKLILPLRKGNAVAIQPPWSVSGASGAGLPGRFVARPACRLDLAGDVVIMGWCPSRCHPLWRSWLGWSSSFGPRTRVCVR